MRWKYRIILEKNFEEFKKLNPELNVDYGRFKDNEGHIFIKIQNEGKETIKFKTGDHIVQGIFINFLKTDSDKNIKSERKSSY